MCEQSYILHVLVPLCGGLDRGFEDSERAICFLGLYTCGLEADSTLLDEPRICKICKYYEEISVTSSFVTF